MSDDKSLTNHPFLLGALVVAGCATYLALTREDAAGTDALPNGTSLDLLARAPDAVFEVPGPIVPRPRVDWGEHGGGGWAAHEASWIDAAGERWIQANQPIAGLRLASSAPTDRMLRLDLWCAERASVAEPKVVIRLNGRALGTHALATDRATLELEVPAFLWTLGENRLELECPRLDAKDALGELRWNVLALARVDYGEAQRVTYDAHAGNTALAPGTGVRYSIETTDGAWLTLAGASTGAGELVVALGRMSARDGTPSGTPATTPIRVDGELDRAFPLPELGDDVATVEVVWHADARGELTLRDAKILEPESTPRPNVVLVSIDTLAARHMSVYGYDRATTPWLERFAKDAVVFEHCVANAPWTLPSYLSALTGLYPLSHFVEGVHSPGVERTNTDFWQASPSRWTLAEALRARGYQTAASVDTEWLARRFRVDQGFDLYDVEPAAYPFDDPAMGIRYILDRFGPWLDEMRRPNAPFFTFIHALDAHGPYWPERPYLETFEGELPAETTPTPAGSAYQTYGAMPDWMAWTNVPPEMRKDVKSWDVPERLPLEEIVARYDEAILKTDASLGALFAMLQERGLYDDSVIVITADHGESFDHDVYSHSVLWEDVVHIPLIIKLPGNERGGTRIAETVQLTDLYPTLFELSGAGQPRGYLHGESLLGRVDGSAAPTPDRPIFSQGGLIDQAMVTADGWKLVELRPGRAVSVASVLTHPRTPRAWIEEHAPEFARTGILTEEMRVALEADADFMARFRAMCATIEGPYYELYHLAEDPRETTDRSAEEPERLARMKDLLDAEIARAKAAQADARPDFTPPPMTPEQKQALEDIGYVGDEGG